MAVELFLSFTDFRHRLLFFPWDYQGYYCSERTFGGETLLIRKTNTRSTTTHVALWETGPNNTWDYLKWPSWTSGCHGSFLFLQKKEKIKDQPIRYLENHSIWWISFILGYFNFYFFKKVNSLQWFFFSFLGKNPSLGDRYYTWVFWEIASCFFRVFCIFMKCIVLGCSERGGSQVKKMFYYCC